MRRRCGLSAVVTLLILVASPHLGAGDCGDVDKSGSVTASDALKVLKFSVGQQVTLTCDDANPLVTGQTTCWTADGTPISCQSTPREDGALQIGVDLHYVSNGDGTIADTSTNLVWEKLGHAGGVHDVAQALTWVQSFEKIAGLNSDNFAGHNDWRLPNVRELESIVDYSADAASSGSTVKSIFNHDCAPSCTLSQCSCTEGLQYWSSTTLASIPADAFAVSFSVGGAFASPKVSTFSVRAVRNAGS
ncbi:MAG TPA: DUF1566 domain-containing protein [Candidatus Binatia bacterium]|jgi:hypothetical protein